MTQKYSGPLLEQGENDSNDSEVVKGNREENDSDMLWSPMTFC